MSTTFPKGRPWKPTSNLTWFARLNTFLRQVRIIFVTKCVQGWFFSLISRCSFLTCRSLKPAALQCSSGAQLQGCLHELSVQISLRIWLFNGSFWNVGIGEYGDDDQKNKLKNSFPMAIMKRRNLLVFWSILVCVVRKLASDIFLHHEQEMNWQEHFNDIFGT